MENKEVRRLELVILLVVVLAVFAVVRPQITGRVVGEVNQSTLDINKVFNKSTELNLSLEGNLTSLAVSGSYSGENVEIYLDDLWVYSSEDGMNRITGNIIGSNGTIENISNQNTNGSNHSQNTTGKNDLNVVGFESECVDTCMLDNYPSNITLNIVLTNATLNLSSISYSYINSNDSAKKTEPEREISYEEFEHTQVKVEQPVKWTKTVKDVDLITIPGSAFNIQSDGEVMINIGDKKLRPEEFSKLKSGKRDKIVLEMINKSKEITIQYETPGPDISEKPIDNYRKHVTISSDIHYNDVLASAMVPEAPKEAINVYWLINGHKKKVDQINYRDTNNNKLVDKIEWIVPHLSNQTYEISITILNPYTYLRDGETWTVAFETTGMANLTITSPNAGWTELLTDDPDTFDEMGFLDLKCGEESLKDELKLVDFHGNVFDYNALESSNSLEIEKLLVEDYSCDDKGYLSNYMHKAGYATLMFEYANQERRLQDYAYDPISKSYNFVGVTQSSNDNYAYEKAGSSNFTGPNDTGDGEASNSDYDNIESSNGNRWITNDASTEGYYDSHLFKFYVSEEESQISEVNFTWEGYGEDASGYDTTLYAWDYDSSEWVQLDQVDFTSSSDQELTFSETTDPGKFIDTDGEVTLMADSKYWDPCGGNTSIDYGGINYDIVAIGDHCWMAEDLAVTDGNESQSCTFTRLCFDDDPSYCDEYGGIYTWDDIRCGETSSYGEPSGMQGICPDGWHVPSHYEWSTLERQVCNDIGNTGCDSTFPKDTSTTGDTGESTTTAEGEGSALAGNCTDWIDDSIDNSGSCNNDFGTSGFNARGSCFRYADTSWPSWGGCIGGYVYYWTASYNAGAWTRFIRGYDTNTLRYKADDERGHSVRCLKDYSSPFLYIVFNGEFMRITDFLATATSAEREYTDYKDVTNTELIDGKVKLMITEELDEVTYLDRVFLRVDGKQIICPEPISGVNHLLIESDDQYLVMEKGDQYILEFSVDNYEKLEFGAEGYFIENKSDGNSIHTDYVEITVTSNAAPNITTPTFSPTTIYSFNDIGCNATPSDVEDSTLDVEYIWYKWTGSSFSEQFNGNNTALSNGTNHVIDTLGAGNTTIGDIWNCTVRSYDNALYSDYRSSTTTVYGKINGTLKNHEGSPVENGKVIAAHQVNSNYSVGTTSDASGIWVINVVQSGNYSVTGHMPTNSSLGGDHEVFVEVTS